MEHKNFKNRFGELNVNFQGLNMKIVEYRKAIDLTVQFDDGTIVNKVSYGEFSRGSIKNLNYPSIFGKGYIGEGKYKAVEEGRLTKQYRTWISMFSRCYNENTLKKSPTYRGVEVSCRWYNFQNFAEWCEENYNSEIMQGWALDKDILVKRNKIYSPETCCFVPKEINQVFVKCDSERGVYPIGVSKCGNFFRVSVNLNKKPLQLTKIKTVGEAFILYKKLKEDEIKRIADKWRGQITEPCYEAMYNYQVEITD